MVKDSKKKEKEIYFWPFVLATFLSSDICSSYSSKDYSKKYCSNLQDLYSSCSLDLWNIFHYFSRNYSGDGENSVTSDNPENDLEGISVGI